jgi:hypothetical protein
MNSNYKFSPTAFIAFLFVSGAMPVTGIAQNWQDPALQQPVRQYFSGTRYPLAGANDAVKVAPRVELPKAKKVAPTAKPKTVVTDKIPTAKPAVDKKTASPLGKKSEKRTDKDKAGPKAKPHHPVKTWDVYRDHSRYPIDPRKPCSVCKREVGKCGCGCQCAHRGIGNEGMPWQDTEPGGRSCGKKNCGDKRPEFSVYWPKPLSAKRENREGCCNGCGHARCQCRKVNDLFDHLVNFSLIDYQRKDNAYCGPGADPYGCLGESRSRVAGVGFRFPSEPIER